MNIKNACIFIAGSANKMPQDVKSALRQIIINYGQYTEKEAIQILDIMSREKRLFIEAWS